MTFIALFRDPAASLATDRVVLGAEEVQPVESAADMARRVAQHLEETEEQLRKVRQHARDEGFAEGREAGLKAAREEIAAELAAMAATAHRQRTALQGSVARLAIQVVRKIAGELGAPEVVAGLAHTAASDLVPGASLRLWVNPSVEKSVRARFDATDSVLRSKSLQVEIRTDETLNPFDCILGTDCGHTLAGLDAQLESLEKVLNEELAKEVDRQ